MVKLWLASGICVLVVLLQCSSIQAELDRCNYDPRIGLWRVYTHAHCNDAQANRSKSLLVDVLKLHGNPYHALYDVGWAVSYYIRNCLRKPFWQFDAKNTFLRVRVNYEMNLTRCEHEPSDEEYNRWEQPSWGACMLLAVATQSGIPISNIDIVPPGRLTNTCHTGVAEFLPRFRNRAYQIGKLPRTKRKKKRFLKDERVDRAFQQIQHDVLSAFNVNRRMAKSDRVNVLLYDRRDRRPYRLKRKWISAQRLEKRLRRDRRVALTYVNELPKSLAQQASLFHSTDILVAPHGAAMANTVFMKDNSHVFEIWKCCKDEVRNDPEEPHPWTGWHASRIGLTLRYVQCHRPNQTLSVAELHQLDENEDEGADRWCRQPWIDVEVDDAYEQVRGAIRYHSQRKGVRGRFQSADLSVAFELVGVGALVAGVFGRGILLRRGVRIASSK
ncbi:unnamed protein product [Agarophyton chilense]